MPRLDGLAVVREARRLIPQMPVVIITGYSSEASAIEAINLGVSGYLTKPFKIAKVLTVAAHALWVKSRPSGPSCRLAGHRPQQVFSLSYKVISTTTDNHSVRVVI